VILAKGKRRNGWLIQFAATSQDTFKYLGTVQKVVVQAIHELCLSSSIRCLSMYSPNKSVVVVAFQSAFHSEKYANNIFLFFKNHF
jgi:hypothetical protein